MKIKVAIIEPVGGYGGMQKYNSALAGGLTSSDAIVTVFTSLGNKEDKNFFNGTFSSSWKILKLLHFFLGVIRTFLYVFFKKYNIIHLHLFHYGVRDYFFVKIFSLLGLPIVATLHDVSSFSGEKDNGYRSKIFLLINGAIVHSQVALDELNGLILRENLSLSSCKIFHGSYSEQINIYDKVLSRKKVLIEEGKRLFLFLGQIKEVKGLDIFLKALSFLPESFFEKNTVLVAGRPWKDDFSKYQDIIDSNNLTNKIDLRIAFIKEDEIDYYYSSSDIVVLPYRKIYQSGVLLSAMSYKKAAICSDIEAMQEVILDGYDGFIFESENPESLAKVLLKCSEISAAELDLIGNRAGDKMSLEYSWKLSGKLTLEYYKKTLEGEGIEV